MRAPCLDAADADGNNALDLADMVYLLRYLYLGDPAPPAPTPPGCGPDPDQPGTNGDLGCGSYDC